MLAQRIDDRYFQAKMHQQIGLIFRSLYDYDEAILSYHEGLKITAKDTFELAHADILNSPRVCTWAIWTRQPEHREYTRVYPYLPKGKRIMMHFSGRTLM